MSDVEPHDRFTPATRDVIAQAKKSVREYKYTHITPEHILLGILAAGDGVVLKGIKAGKATPAQIKVLVQHHLRPGEHDVPEEQLSLSERAKRVVEAAKEESVRAQKPQIAPEHLLLGLTRVRNTVASAVLAAVDLQTDLLRDAMMKP
jgi:ATP-dependent Clp protease ATP-binding subunit ClpC